MDNDGVTIPPAQSPDDDPPLCPNCGYDLRGFHAERCSECGHTIDWAALAVSGFPWAHRQRIGRVRAYLRTLWLVIVNSRRLQHEAVKPQLLADARIFRRSTAIIVAAVLVGVFAVVAVSQKGLVFMAVQPEPFQVNASPSRWMYDLTVPWSAGATLWPVIPACLILLAFALASAVRSLFRIPSASARQQDRAAAISCYAIATLVGCLPIALWWAIWLYGEKENRFGRPVLFAAAGALWLLLTIGRILQWVSRSSHCGIGGMLVALIKLLGLWGLCIVVLLGVLPWCVGFLWIIADSFR
ncbi:MAG: hypothetical protein ABSH20_00585 [Tepidisphaeraceae bacterium]|jgi:hypothetical protein